MDVPARVTSKGQITIPKSVRDALGVNAGDQMIFRIDGTRAVVARTANLLDLGGVVPVPPERAGAQWAQIRAATRTARAAKQR